MEQFALNEKIFLALNAQPAADGAYLIVALILSNWPALVGVTVVVAVWLLLAERSVRGPAALFLALALAVGLASAIAYLAYQPRPFALGIGQPLAEHKPNASLPSNHATYVWTLALMILARPGRALLGIALALLALGTCWSRLYLGVHWPLDLVAGLLVAVVATATVNRLLPPEAAPRRSRYRVWRFE